MRKTLSIVASVVIFTLLTAVCIKAAGEFLEKRDADVKYEQFFQSDTNFDVIFMGTSHVYNTVMPQELWRSAHIISDWMPWAAAQLLNNSLWILPLATPTFFPFKEEMSSVLISVLLRGTKR